MKTNEIILRTERFLQNNPDIINKATSFWKENRQLSQEIKKLELTSNLQIQKITQRYELCRDTLNVVFAERGTALMAHYKTLDKALESDDRELIIASLNGISNIVAQNPLESFFEFTKVLDNVDEVLTLDF